MIRYRYMVGEAPVGRAPKGGVKIYEEL